MADEFTLNLNPAPASTTSTTPNFSEKSFTPPAMPQDLSDKLAVGVPSDDDLTAQIRQILNDFTSLDTVNVDNETALLEKGGTIRPKNGSHLVFATPNGFARVKSVTLPARPFLPVSPDGQLQSDGDRRLIEVALAALTAGT